MSRLTLGTGWIAITRGGEDLGSDLILPHRGSRMTEAVSFSSFPSLENINPEESDTVSLLPFETPGPSPPPASASCLSLAWFVEKSNVNSALHSYALITFFFLKLKDHWDLKKYFRFM